MAHGIELRVDAQIVNALTNGLNVSDHTAFQLFDPGGDHIVY